MPGLSSAIYQRCREVLLKCTEFDADSSLHVLFATAELAPFRSGLPEAASKSARVDGYLVYLTDRRLSDGRAVLPLFLAALRERYSEGDALRNELGDLVQQVSVALLSVSNMPITISVPAGPFWMGSLPDDPEAYPDEKLCREVYLPEYSISRYPVTNAEYARFLAGNPTYAVPHLEPYPASEKEVEEMARPYTWDSHNRTFPEGKADHPVVLVGWEDASAYCRWLSQVTRKHYRLPTEEEWEKAARGGLPETRRYPWGNKWRLNFCNTLELKQDGTTSVYAFEKTNQSPFGVVDMAGNVWEWTDSSYESEHYGRCYIVRGGSWQNSGKKACISYRGRYPPDKKCPYLGFRIVLEKDG